MRAWQHWNYILSILRMIIILQMFILPNYYCRLQMNAINKYTYNSEIHNDDVMKIFSKTCQMIEERISDYG